MNTFILIFYEFCFERDGGYVNFSKVVQPYECPNYNLDIHKGGINLNIVAYRINIYKILENSKIEKLCKRCRDLWYWYLQHMLIEKNHVYSVELIKHLFFYRNLYPKIFLYKQSQQKNLYKKKSKSTDLIRSNTLIFTRPNSKSLQYNFLCEYITIFHEILSCA